MRVSSYQLKKYGDIPAAQRGVVKTYGKLIRSNRDSYTTVDEIDVEVRQWGRKDFRVTTNDETLGTYKDLAAANGRFQEYTAKMKGLGWKLMNERTSYSVSQYNVTLIT